jgi:hypothetical protein
MPSSSLRVSKLLGGIAPFTYLQFLGHSLILPSTRKFIILPRGRNERCYIALSRLESRKCRCLIRNQVQYRVQPHHLQQHSHTMIRAKER